MIKKQYIGEELVVEHENPPFEVGVEYRKFLSCVKVAENYINANTVMLAAPILAHHLGCFGQPEGAAINLLKLICTPEDRTALG